MNIWRISTQNIKSKPLYPTLSIIILTMSISLLLGIEQLKNSFENQINNNIGNVDIVIGAKGSPLQLVLSSVLHIDNPTGNMLLSEADKIRKNPAIKTSAPISYGDNYKGYRILGSTNDFLKIYNAELKKGSYINKKMDVIIGYSVAKKLKIKIGDTFNSSHGLVENSINVHKENFKVVGILKPTKKVIDNLIICNLESIWEIHKHHEHGHNHEHNTHKPKEITSLLISIKTPSALLTLPRKINKKPNIIAALPKFELNKLYKISGLGISTISTIAYALLIISGITIFINLFQMIKERSFEIALLRTYGANKIQIFKMVSFESGIVVLLSCISAFIINKIGFYVVNNMTSINKKITFIAELKMNQYAYIISLIVIMMVISTLLAIYPIIKMNISTILKNEK